MPKYSRFQYAQNYYGAIPAVIGYSVEPIRSFVHYYGKNNGLVEITFAPPTGNFSEMRIVRNQDAFPETAEDGIIIFDKFNTVENPVTDVYALDTYSGDYPEFASGRYAYYRAWLRKADNVWYPAGDTYVLIPSEHATKTSRNTTRTAIEEGVAHKVIAASITDGVATITTEMDVTTDSTAFAFETYIRVGDTIRLYGLDDHYFGTQTVTAIAPYSFSFNLDWVDEAEHAVAGLVRLYPGESEEPGHGGGEYSNVELLSTHDKLMDLLPRVFTSAAHSPLDEVDTNSALYRFMGAFAATIDESLTYADLLKPEYNGRSANPTTLALAANMYGLTTEPGFATKSQKKMIREARYINSRKGTVTATETLVESLSGFAPNVSVANNTLLSVQDSTFYKGTGFWETSGDVAITAVNAVEDLPLIGIPSSTEPNAIDTSWLAEVVVGTAGASLVNGASDVFTKAVPVSSGVEYTFSYYAKGTGTVVPSITWYNQFGEGISTVTGTGVTLTGDWEKDATLTATAPVANGTTIPYDATYVSFELTFEDAGTYYLDMISFADSGITFYDEARAVNVFVYPSKYNFINNPSFEGWTGSAFNDWTVTGATVDQIATTLETSYGETYMMEFTPSGGVATMETVSATGIGFSNNFYTFSIYAKTATGTEVVQLTLTADDDDLPPITHTTTPFTLTTEWQRISVTIKVPQEFNATSTTLTSSLSGDFSGDNIIYFDNAQTEMRYSPSDYFDGSAGYVQGAFWAGTEHQSASYLYPNIMTKMTRLVSEIPNYIAINQPFTISTAYRLEYKNIT